MMRLPSHCCLDRLTWRDFEFVADVMGPSSPVEREALHRLMADRETLVEILDDDAVHRAVLELAMPLTISPELYFYVLVRRAMRSAEIGEVSLAEYVASTLAGHAYGKSDGGGEVSNGPEQRIDLNYHVDYLEALERATPYERFFIQVFCGNRFLFLTGLYPRFLRRRRDRQGAPGVRYYEELARRAFLSASRHPLANEFCLATLYEGLAGSLHDTRQALNRMADDCLFLDGLID